MKNKFKTFTLSLCASLTFVACSTTQPSIQANEQITGHKWQLNAIMDKEISLENNNMLPFVVIQKDAKLYGFDGCNRFFGSYKIDKNEIIFSSLASTKMFCHDTMKSAENFIKAIEKTKGYKIKDGHLNFFDENEISLLKFSPTKLP